MGVKGGDMIRGWPRRENYPVRRRQGGAQPVVLNSFEAHLDWADFRVIVCLRRLYAAAADFRRAARYNMGRPSFGHDFRPGFTYRYKVKAPVLWSIRMIRLPLRFAVALFLAAGLFFAGLGGEAAESAAGAAVEVEETAALPDPLSEAGLRRVLVKTVLVDSQNNQPVVVLEDKQKGTLLPIWIGPAEARAIMMQLNGVIPPRPMTHDLLRNIIGGLRAKVIRVIITELKGRTFYAHIVMKSPGRRFAIDSRPSDAIALALRVKAPIFAKAKVLSDGAIKSTSAKLTHRDYLGVVLQSMTPLLARYFGGGKTGGLLVAQVAEGQPADKSGLQRGDVIFLVEGKEALSVELFERLFAKNSSGMNISVRRGNKGEPVQLRLLGVSPKGPR